VHRFIFKKHNQKHETPICQHPHSPTSSQVRLFDGLSVQFVRLAHRKNNALRSSLDPSKSEKCEPKTLTKNHIAWHDQTYLRKKSRQDNYGVLRFQDMVRDWTPRLNADDLRDTMSTTDMTTLLKQLSEVFFGAVIPLDHTDPQPVFQ
jgi:hypothetical protein